MHKLSYPQQHAFDKPFSESHLKQWRELQAQITVLTRAYPEYTRSELINRLTPKWSGQDRERFTRWLKFYAGHEDKKYSASDRLLVKIARYTLYLGRRRLSAEARHLRNIALGICAPYTRTITNGTLRALIRWGAEDVSSGQASQLIEQIDRLIDQNQSEDKDEYTWKEIKQLCIEADAPDVKKYLAQTYFIDSGVPEDDEEVWDEDDFIGDLEDLRDALGSEEQIPFEDTAQPEEDLEVETAKEAIAEYSMKDLKRLGPRDQWASILEDEFYNLIGEHRREELKITGDDLLELVQKGDAGFDITDQGHFIEFNLLLQNPTMDTQSARRRARELQRELKREQQKEQQQTEQSQ